MSMQQMNSDRWSFTHRAVWKVLRRYKPINVHRLQQALSEQRRYSHSLSGETFKMEVSTLRNYLNALWMAGEIEKKRSKTTVYWVD